MINTTPLGFSTLNDVYREYDFLKDGCLATIRIEKPRFLNVNPIHGAHRILDAADVVHYIPSGWIALRWSVEEGTPHFHTTLANPATGETKQVQH